MEETNVLRILIIFCFLISIKCHAEYTNYQEPDNDTLNKSKVNFQNMFEKSDALIKDDNFLNTLRTQRLDMNQIPNGIKPNLYNFNGISPEIREERFISKALAAGEKINTHEAEPWTNAPLVMVSFSMPENAIKRLMSEAARVGANVVLRGAYNNDLPTTIKRIQRIASENGAGGVQIDPTLFSRFNVLSVPTFVLPLEPIKTCDESGCEIPAHVKAHGTATLKYFLEKVSRLGDKKEKVAANTWLNNYKENKYDD